MYHSLKKMKRTLEQILTDFEKPIESQFISKKPVFTKGKKSGEVGFVAWPTMCRLLNLHTAGYWEWKVRTQFMGDRTVIEGSLTIHGTDGSLTRESTGNESSDIDGYGDPSSNAEAMALRRCCAKFGLGLNLWEKVKSPTSQIANSAQKVITTKNSSKETLAIWNNWKTPDDAIIWASEQLESWDLEEIQKEFDELPATNGKKAPAWAERVAKLAAK